MRAAWLFILVLGAACSAPSTPTKSQDPVSSGQVEKLSLEQQFFNAVANNNVKDAFAFTSATFQLRNNPATVEGRYNAFLARVRRHTGAEPREATTSVSPLPLPKTVAEVQELCHEVNPSEPSTWKRASRLDLKSPQGEAIGTVYLLVVDDQGLDRIGGVWFQLVQPR